MITCTCCQTYPRLCIMATQSTSDQHLCAGQKKCIGSLCTTFNLHKDLLRSLILMCRCPPAHLAGHHQFKGCVFLLNKNWVTVRNQCPQINVKFQLHTFLKKKIERTDKRTDGQTDRRTDGLILLCPNFIWGHKNVFGPCVKNKKKFQGFSQQTTCKSYF